MKMKLLLFALLLQALPLFCQYRQKTIQAAPDGANNILISVGSYYPLKDTIDYLNHEYGWRVSYEDPLYSKSQIADIAVPEWKKAHPGERGFYVPKWTEVSFHIAKPSGQPGESNKILEALIAQYNRLEREDKFVVLNFAGNQNVVIGSESGMQVLAHATVRPENNERNGSEEMQLLIEQCGAQMPMRLVVGTVSANTLMQIKLPPRKTDSSCRNALLALTNQSGENLVYQIMEDITDQTFIVSIIPNRETVHTRN